ncbi:hypothetical protein OF83DRAFT_1089378, partial [Amylostereum chailletii]
RDSLTRGDIRRIASIARQAWVQSVRRPERTTRTLAAAVWTKTKVDRGRRRYRRALASEAWVKERRTVRWAGMRKEPAHDVREERAAANNSDLREQGAFTMIPLVVFALRARALTSLFITGDFPRADRTLVVSELLLTYGARSIDLVTKNEEGHLGELLDRGKTIEHGLRLGEMLKVGGINQEDNAIDLREPEPAS